MFIPSKVKIGGIYYKVVFTDYIDKVVNNRKGRYKDAHYAEIDYSVAKIKILKRIPRALQEQALYHEVLHAMNDKLSEKDTEFLAQAMYQFHVDNNLLRG